MNWLFFIAVVFTFIEFSLTKFPVANREVDFVTFSVAPYLEFWIGPAVAGLVYLLLYLSSKLGWPKSDHFSDTGWESFRWLMAVWLIIGQLLLILTEPVMRERDLVAGIGIFTLANLLFLEWDPFRTASKK